MSDFKGQLTSIKAIKEFVLAGRATITIRSVKTGTRLTFKITSPNNDKPSRPIWFVSVLNGSDNESDYQYFGNIRDDLSFDIGRKSRIRNDAPAAKAFAWFWEHVRRNQELAPELVQVWHEGRCGRCGRKLTVPESIETGFGPECVQMIGGKSGTNASRPAQAQMSFANIPPHRHPATLLRGRGYYLD